MATTVFEKPMGAEVEALKGQIGALSSLTTTAKNNVVSAVNEVNSKIGKQDLSNPTILTASNNMNNIGYGVFRQYNTDIPVNAPSSKYNALIFSIKAAQDGTIQIWFCFNDGKVYTRSCFAGTTNWSAWAESFSFSVQ